MARKQAGSGNASFITMLLIMVVCGYVGFTVFPVYYNAKEFETALVNEGVRVGARRYSDEQTITEVIHLAKSYDIKLKSDDVKIRRFGEKVELTVEYDMPLVFSLINYVYNWHFVAQTTSHLGMI